MRKQSIAVGILAGVSVVLLAGCGGRRNVVAEAPQAAPAPVAVQAPEWVTKGSGAFKDAGNGVFYGVGMFSGSKNRALAQDEADLRARAAIAKSLDTYVAVLTKDYMAATTTGDGSTTSDEQHVSNTLKGFTQFTLHGALIVDHWRDPSDGTVFSLARLDMASVKAMLDQSKELDSQVRDYVKANADKAFDELKEAEAASKQQ